MTEGEDRRQSSGDLDGHTLTGFSLLAKFCDTLAPMPLDSDNLPAIPVFDKRITPDPKMMLEIASGLEEGWEIADRYGYTTREWEDMQAQEGFQKQIAALRAEMKLNGVTFQRKAAMMAEDLLTDLFVLAKQSKSLSEVLEVARFAARMGKLEPASGEKGGGAGGNQFAIQFNFTNAPGAPVDPAVIVPQVTNDLIRQLNADLGADDGTTDNGVVRGGGPGGIGSEAR